MRAVAETCDNDVCAINVQYRAGLELLTPP
jgi:hypothetical protein